MKGTIEIKFMEEWAKDHGLIVVEMVNGEAWFYDAWYRFAREDAIKQAKEIGGLVVEMEW